MVGGAATAFLAAAPSVWAQGNPVFQVRPGQPINAFGGGVGSSISPYAMGYNPFVSGATGTPFVAPSTNPYAAAATITSNPVNPGAGFDPGAFNNLYNNPFGYNPYGFGWGESPIGGYMRGYADVITSVTRGMIDEQTSFLLREKVKQERLETQRRALDNWLYWREKAPTAEDDRQRFLQMQVRRALNDPPAGEIYSGRAMNTILDDLGRKLGKDAQAQGPAIPLDDEVLRHLNFTGQENKGNPGLLRNEGRLTWPMVLRGPQFKTDRDLLNDLTPTVYEQAVAGRVDAGALESMTRAVKNLQDGLNENIRELTPNQHSEASRFLREFDEALVLLRQPNAGDFFGQKAPKAKTISDLVQQMVGKGIRFAPATSGDESAYVAVHRGLAIYATNAASQVATDKAEK
jgi:hypothetical protein